MKIISNTQINHLYIDKNKITNFNELLKILYRTKLIEDINKNKIDISNVDTPLLINFNICKSDIIIKNAHLIELLSKIIKQTTLKCLDISKILLGPFPDRNNNKDMKNIEYKSKVERLKSILELDKKNYLKAMEFINLNKDDISKLKYLENEKILYQFDDEISKILENKKVKFISIKKEAKTLINKLLKDIENKDELEEKLVNYITLKRAEKEIREYEKIVKLKKLIII